MNWYKLSQYEEQEEDYLDTYQQQAWRLAQDSEINILSDKELARVSVENGELLGALWTAWDRDGGFSFDVIVDPKHRGMGIGSKLVNEAIEIFDWESEAFDNSHFDLDVVNQYMVEILKKKGFIITKKVGNHILMSMGDNNELV